MRTDWSDDIVIENLSDEPSFSEDLSTILDRVSHSAKNVPHVVLNMSAVTYLNSSNLAHLVKLRNALLEKGKTLKLCSLCEEVESLLKVTGLNKILRSAPDPLTALAGIQIETGGVK